MTLRRVGLGDRAARRRRRGDSSSRRGGDGGGTDGAGGSGNGALDSELWGIVHLRSTKGANLDGVVGPGDEDRRDGPNEGTSVGRILCKASAEPFKLLKLL